MLYSGFQTVLVLAFAAAAAYAGPAISTLAGNGNALYSGDNVPAISAALNAPAAVTADVTGAVYIADTFNHRVRRVVSNGVITTIAGTGVPGYSGDGGLAPLDDDSSSPGHS